MNSVMPASWAKFLHFQTLGSLLSVFCCRVISFFAVSTLHCNDIAHNLLSAAAPAALLNNLSYSSRSHSAAAFSNGESQALFQSHRRDQLDHQTHVVSRHHHLHPFGHLRRPRHVRRPKVKLRPVPL